MSDTHPIRGVLPDLLKKNLKAILCGSAAGHHSAQNQTYYSGPGNRFWQVLYQIGLTPIQLQPMEYSKLSDYGLGLTDLAKNTFGSDRDIAKSADDPNALTDKILNYRPLALAFIGKRPAAVWLQKQLGIRRIGYGIQAHTIDKTAIFVLPSTSGAAKRYWDITHWRDFAKFINGSGEAPE